MILAIGIDKIREKSEKLTVVAVQLYGQWLAPLGMTLGTPEKPELRGSHVALCHENAWPIANALNINQNVIPDFRPPNIVRIGLTFETPFMHVYDGLANVRKTIETRAYGQFSAPPGRVT